MHGKRRLDRTGKVRPAVWVTAWGLATILSISLGCREYSRVQTKEGLVLIRALYTACSSRSSARLQQVKQRLQQAQAEQAVGEADARSLRAIIVQAERGDWQRAQQEVYQMARDQVR